MPRDAVEPAAAGDGDAAGAPIAAFAVTKGGVLLKHIFLNAPPPGLTRGEAGEEEGEGEEDPPVMVGRHPDCHVLVDHPSVSRFHLQLRARRRQRRITATDLSSVHGTFVSGRRIPPNTPVDLAPGDTLRLGASKREYRLLWLSLREAFEMEDPLPPLLEDDKEEARTDLEASNKLAPGQRDSADVETHKETRQQIVPEKIAVPAEVIPSAPPMPEFAQSIYLGESVPSQFHESREEVIDQKSVDKNPVTERFGSLIIQEMPVGRQVQSDKRDASSQVSQRVKLKSVKSLRIDTGRSRERSSALRYSIQKGDQNEILVCSQNCGTECAACIALFGISESEGAKEKEQLIEQDKGQDKGHMNPPASITMEVNKEEQKPDNCIPQDSVDAKLQKTLGLLHSIIPLHFKDGAFEDKEIPQWSSASVNIESSEPVPENLFMEENRCDGLMTTLDLEEDLSNNENMAPTKIDESPADCQFGGTIYGNLFDNSSLHFKDDASEDREIPQWSSASVNIESSEPVPENLFMQENKCDGLMTTLDLEEDLSNNENMAPTKIAESPTDCQFGDTEGTKENEEISTLDKENITPYVSGNMITVRSRRGLKPTNSQELIDSISPLNLEHDSFSENENSILSIGNQMKSNEPASENPNPLISTDTELQKSKTEFMPITYLDFQDDILQDKENSAIAPGKYDRISPVRRQEDLFSDKENVTPTSRDLKPSGRRVLGARMDNSVSAENSSNKRIAKWGCKELSGKPKGIHAVDDDVFYSDKENLTPISSGVMKARKCPLKTRTVGAGQDHEAFCSDKENSTPLSSAPQKTRDMSENRARIESAITKKRVVDRIPFQTLVSNSPLRPTSSGCSCSDARAADFDADNLAIRLEDELNHIPCNTQESGRFGGAMKVWTMVADTDSLLDEESRKSIMLLKGLKGTRLVVPMIVIRELDCMKQREGLFRRSSKATSILQWIEECMENESWWIHVQSSSDMFPVAPTPPATPKMQCNDQNTDVGSGAFNPMSLFSPRSFADIVSPKPEDRVLDCALLFNKPRSNQSIVILSSSITLKIKAMAEGLLCEGAKEFRESLMNPCSGRFMWGASVPRGSAWSRLDEAALAENYYNSHHHGRKRIPRPNEAAKGLKLILRHNSLYAQVTNPVRKAPLASLASV